MLSIRLQAIADLVNSDSIIADIGSDHGLLPCFLAKENLVKKAYAVDNKEGPLKFADDNVKTYNLKDKVFLVLADGLDDLKPDVTSIVIAGMGFLTIQSILNSNFDKVLGVSQVIIQSNTEVNNLRKWIMDKGFLIEAEVIVKDKDKLYTIISFNPQKAIVDKNQSHYVSLMLLDNNKDLYLQSLKERKSKLENIIKYRPNKELKKELLVINDFISKNLR